MTMSCRNKLYRSVAKILLAHRNSKIFLVMMSGPFLIAVYIIKYALKILVLYYLYKKTGGKSKANEQADPAELPTKKESSVV